MSSKLGPRKLVPSYSCNNLIRSWTTGLSETPRAGREPEGDLPKLEHRTADSQGPTTSEGSSPDPGLRRSTS